VSGARAARSTERRWLAAIVAVTALAALLRFVDLGQVPLNLYYDAAVRSMTLSLHNFLYGAFDPSATTSIDKPPIDLWLQVISVKIFGWGSVSLKLPEALAGILAVPLLYDVVRRIAGPLAALGSALTLAVLPTSVVTARSDTMDSVMMVLLLVVAWLLVRSVQRRELRWLVAAAVVLGVAFNVKLFEALVPAPAFLLFVWLCWGDERRSVRVRRLLIAGAAFVAVALSWIVFFSLTPAHDRPYPIGSTDGSAWNAVFVYNGIDRITKAPEPRSFSTVQASEAPGVTAAHSASVTAAHSASVTAAHSASVTAAHSASVTAASRTTINSKTGPLRLFQYSLVGYGTRVGTLLFAAIVFGLVALAPMLRRRLRAPPGATREERIRWAAALGVALWLAIGWALFSFAARTQPRYLEAFTPAIAIALGCSIPVLVRRSRDLFGAYVLLATFAIAMLEGAAETASGKLGYLAVAIAAVLAIPVVAYVAFGYAHSVRAGRWPRWYRDEVVVLGMLAALLAFPAVRDVLLIRDRSGNQAAEPTLGATIINPIARFLERHTAGMRYEVAAAAPTIVAPFIVRDARPVLLMTTVAARPFLTLPQLRSAHAAGQVRYVLNHGSCSPVIHVALPDRPACSDVMRWVRAHARDVTSQLGLSKNNTGLLYDLDLPTG
jgi:4-amino-4-deoxy-L-arabinose transferase-like glycosyltransferase